MAEEGVPPVEYTALKPGVIRDQREGGQKVGQLKKGETVLVLQDDGEKVRIDRGWIGKVTAKGAVVLEKTGGGGAGAAQPSEKEAGGAAAGGTALVGTSYMDEAREKKKAEMRAKREEADAKRAERLQAAKQRQLGQALRSLSSYEMPRHSAKGGQESGEPVRDAGELLKLKMRTDPQVRKYGWELEEGVDWGSVWASYGPIEIVGVESRVTKFGSKSKY